MNNNCCVQTLFNTSSIIPDPICVSDCPADFSCPNGIINSGCVVYNGPTLPCLDIPSGSPLNTFIAAVDTLCSSFTPPVNPCKVKVDADDTCCDYLINKVKSNTINITSAVSGDCKILSLEVPIDPCSGKVLVNSSDTCNYLITKFSTNGSVAPMLDTTSGQQIKFIRQQATFNCAPQVVTNSSNCGAGIGSGSILNTGWSNGSNSFISGNPTQIAGSFQINKTGVYDVSLIANFLLNTSATNAPSFVRAALVQTSGGICTGCGVTIAIGTVFCSSQSTTYSNAIIKGVTLSAGEFYAVKVYNTTGVATTTGGSNIALSFEFVST